MRTIRAIFRDGNLEPLDPVDLPENTRLTVALLDDDDDLSPEALVELAAKGGALDFLGDEREDLYSDADGEAV
jgi:predicted DNA-binding antitoxin AbrB/MazE fold protein